MLNTTALEANIQHLKPSTGYHFRVLAHNAAGPSSAAAEITVTTQAEGKETTVVANSCSSRRCGINKVVVIEVIVIGIV